MADPLQDNRAGARSHSFIYSTNIYEHLLCSRHWARDCGYIGRKGIFPSGLTLGMGLSEPGNRYDGGVNGRC